MKTLRFIFFLTLLLAGVQLPIAGQSNKPLRIEFSSFGKSDAYALLRAEEHGFVVIRDEGKNDDNQNLWSFFGYNVDMKRIWKSKVTLPKDYRLAKKTNYKTHACILFLQQTNRATDITEVRINMADGSVEKNSLTSDGKIEIQDYKVIEDQSFILALDIKGMKNIFSRLLGSSDAGRRLKFWRSDWSNSSYQELSDSIADGMRPKRIDIFLHGETVDVYAVRDVNQQRDDIWLYSFTYQGEYINKYRFSPVDGRFVVEMAVRSEGRNRYLAATMSGIRDRYDRYEDYSDGIYLGVFRNGEEAVSRFYKLTNLNAFYAKADADMFRFFPGKKEMGGSVGYPLDMHPTIKGKGNEMIILAEAYYPEYRTEWYYDAYGMAHTRHVFDGYRYTHALAIAFNSDAQILWDEGLKISNIRSYYRKRRVDVISDGTTAGIAYNLDNEIHYQLVVNGDADGGTRTVTLPLLSSNDLLKSSNEGSIHYWYEDYLLASGYQKIAHADQGNRQIFYVYKIGFQ